MGQAWFQKCAHFHGLRHNITHCTFPETKDSKENGVISRSVTPIPSRPTTPKPPNGSDQFRSGMLTIRIFSGMALPRPYTPSVCILTLRRSWTLSCTWCASTRGHPEGPGVRTAVSQVDEQSRQHPRAAAQTLLVASIRRPRVRQERNPYRWTGWRPHQSIVELPRRLVRYFVFAPQYSISSSAFVILLNSDVSRTSNISVSAYLRTTTAGQDDMGNDLLMARVDLVPMLEGHASSRPLRNITPLLTIFSSTACL